MKEERKKKSSDHPNPVKEERKKKVQITWTQWKKKNPRSPNLVKEEEKKKGRTPGRPNLGEERKKRKNTVETKPRRRKKKKKGRTGETEPRIRKEEKKGRTGETEPRRKKKKEKEEHRGDRTQEKKGKGKKKGKGAAELWLVGPLCVFNYKNVIELWVMETENSQNVFLVSITHNSKIRELSDEIRVIVCQTTFLLWVPPFLSYELCKQKIELWK